MARVAVTPNSTNRVGEEQGVAASASNYPFPSSLPEVKAIQLSPVPPAPPTLQIRPAC
jgi:hypothetical protein